MIQTMLLSDETLLMMRQSDFNLLLQFYKHCYATRFRNPAAKGELHCYWCGQRTWEGSIEYHDHDCPVIISKEILERFEKYTTHNE